MSHPQHLLYQGQYYHLKTLPAKNMDKQISQCWAKNVKCKVEHVLLTTAKAFLPISSKQIKTKSIKIPSWCWVGLHKHVDNECSARKKFWIELSFPILPLLSADVLRCATSLSRGVWRRIFKIQIPRDANIPHFPRDLSFSGRFLGRNNFSVWLQGCVIFTSFLPNSPQHGHCCKFVRGEF